MRAPKQTEATILFENEHSEFKKSILSLRSSAIRGLCTIEAYNLKAKEYNEMLAQAGGQSGFGLSFLKGGEYV